MGLKLEKLQLPTESAIKAMAQDELRGLTIQWRERIEVYESLLFKARRQLYGRQSERSNPSLEPKPPTARGETTKQLSERYPEARVEVDELNFATPQTCPACGEMMQESGMSENCEYLDVTPKEFIVVEQRRHKHRCGNCHGSIVTAPCPPRVIPGGSYSDELIVDATLSKFSDLIPMDRYTKMAGRSGLEGLPPHSLIKASFGLARFLMGVYALIKSEVLAEAVLRADETPHRMLEGDAKKRWFLWGFSVEFACFFECHDTRSGDVSTEVLNLSACLILLTDVYAGYSKSIRLANKIRVEEGRPLIVAANCNAHARREFWAGDWDSPEMNADQTIVIEHYKLIYKLNKESKGLLPEGILQTRQEMKPHFEAIKAEAEAKINTYSSKSQMATAYNYFLKNYDGLTLFLTNHLIPIDNNGSERLLRSHVVGRKTWYGTHSRKGAEVAAVHFTIVETCKLNGLNPREYYTDAIRRIHSNCELLTPRQYKMRQQPDTG
jgi:transposase